MASNCSPEQADEEEVGDGRAPEPEMAARGGWSGDGGRRKRLRRGLAAAAWCGKPGGGGATGDGGAVLREAGLGEERLREARSLGPGRCRGGPAAGFAGWARFTAKWGSRELTWRRQRGSDNVRPGGFCPAAAGGDGPRDFGGKEKEIFGGVFI